MVMCIIPTNFRLIAEILKKSGNVVQDGQTERRTDGPTDGRNDWRQYSSAPMATEGKKQVFHLSSHILSIYSYISIIV